MLLWTGLGALTSAACLAVGTSSPVAVAAGGLLLTLVGLIYDA